MVTAVVMVGEEGEAPGAAAWVQQARRAATVDLLHQLGRQPLISEIILASPSPVDVQLRLPRYSYLPTVPGPIHVGEFLAHVVFERQPAQLLYFGGGAAPLLSDEELSQVVNALASSNSLVVTNNQFASDWAAFTPASTVADWSERLPRDNMLGWVLGTEARLPVQALPARASTRLDIDTPSDLLALSLHPHTKPALKCSLEELPLQHAQLLQALEIINTPAAHVFVAGRFAPDAWLALNRMSQAWIRVLAEERGMVSSGRQARGEVRSLLAEHVGKVGESGFFDWLSETVDAAFIDTRVLLAHHGKWPDAAVRFASDLGLLDEIEDEWLREFTAAAMACRIPVVLGGHGLLSGDMFAFCEIIAGWKSAN